MNKKDFYYHLPDHLIAQTPATPRDSSKMLVYHGLSGEIEHKHFYDICDYLRKGDVLVINNTKVLPARIFGKKESGGKVEFLLLKRLDYSHWQVLAKPGKNANVGQKIYFDLGLCATVEQIIEGGVRVVDFQFEGVFENILATIGDMPLPPYIKEKLRDKDRYNTVYSLTQGSAAAPTAGLHFTPQLLEKLRQKGVEIVSLLLHVGLGTFRPVKEDNIEQHKMHSEYYELSEDAAQKINRAKMEGRRVIAVGTTSTRVLESVASVDGRLVCAKGNTEIFIYPPYKFKVIDGLITNFHLPESTLLMLISAFCSTQEVMRMYEVAVKNNYRFFSFGDATFLINKE